LLLCFRMFIFVIKIRDYSGTKTKIMATIKFLIRAAKRDKLAPVFVRVKHGTAYDVFTDTQQKTHPNHWNRKTGRIKNIADATYKDQVNKQLDHLEMLIKHTISTAGNNVTKDLIFKTIDRYYNPEKYEPKKPTLFEFIRKFIDQAQRRVNPKTGRPVCYKQIREYERTFFYLQHFAKHKRRRMDFKDITLDFYHDFVEYLQSEKTLENKSGELIKEQGLAQNTIGKKIQTLKIFLNAATDEGINEYQHYKSHRFKAMTEETESIYLTEAEIQEIYDLDLSQNKRLEKARDLFLIGCWTGLRYSDWDKVTPGNIEDGFLTLKQTKTGGAVVIPLHEMVTAVIEKYNGNLPPVISNQKFNDYLKDVAKLAGLNSREQKSFTKGGIKRTVTHEKWELVSTHAGRRSFATNLYKAGLPSLTIMQVTGHKTEAAFLKYIKVTPREHAEKLKEFWQNRPVMRVINQ